MLLSLCPYIGGHGAPESPLGDRPWLNTLGQAYHQIRFLSETTVEGLAHQDHPPELRSTDLPKPAGGSTEQAGPEAALSTPLQAQLRGFRK